MAELTPHERYLLNLPLNDELAAFKEGRITDRTAAPAAAAPPIEEPARELRTTERQDLRDLRRHPGWPVMLRLMERMLHHHEKSAIAMSEVDPLANSYAIAQKWAYVNLMKRLKGELLANVELELAALEKSGR